MAQDAPAYYNPFGTTANPKYNPYAGPTNIDVSHGIVEGCGFPGISPELKAACEGGGKKKEEEKRTGGAGGPSQTPRGTIPGTPGGRGPMEPAGSPTGGPGGPGEPPGGPEGGPEGSPFEFPPFPGGQPPGPGGPTGNPDPGGGGSPYSMMGLDQAGGGEQMLSAPSSLRQGIGTRIQPQLSMALAGLKRIY